MGKPVVISSVELFYVRPRWQFLRITTSEGTEGWSEAILEGNARAVRGAVETLADYLVGKDPRAITHHWHRMYTDNFYRGGPVLVSAISAIDIALWDIKGKLLGVPIFELLGGAVRSAVPVYCHVGGETADDLAEDARAAVREGFKIVKTGLRGPAPRLATSQYIDGEVERFGKLRAALGSACEFAIDFHGRATPALSRVLIHELEQFRPLFIEEPCLPENATALVDIRSATTIPIATGERLFTRWGFREAIELRVADVYQPDVCHAGGISELVKIAAQAEIYYAQIAPHNPLGPIALAASLQVDCACENILAQELVRDLGTTLLERSFELSDGMIVPSGDPGLGITVNVEAVKAAEYSGDWSTPQLSYDDGSVAAW